MTANTTGSLTTTSVNHLNMMNRAAQDVALGTRLSQLPTQMVSGSYTLVLADTIGTKVTQFDGFTGEKAAIVTATRSGSPISGSPVSGTVTAPWRYALSGSSLNVYTGSSVSGSTFTTGDNLAYIIF
jgi:hypothetical protein